MGTGYFDHGKKNKRWKVVYCNVESQTAIFPFVFLICIRFDMVSQCAGINSVSVNVSQQKSLRNQERRVFSWLIEFIEKLNSL
jgi:hypothetical protein